jgi:hypothetical protein
MEIKEKKKQEIKKNRRQLIDLSLQRIAPKKRTCGGTSIFTA